MSKRKTEFDKLHMIVTKEDVIGNKKLMTDMEAMIKTKQPILLVGTQGIGKTSISRMLLRENGYKIIEINMSLNRKEKDLVGIYYACRIKHLRPTAFLLDEIDGIKKFNILEMIVKDTVNPIILTCNDDYKIPSNIKKKCFVEKLRRPMQKSVLKLVKDLAKKYNIKNADFSSVSNDVRSSIQILLGDSGYEDKDNFSLIHEILMGNASKYQMEIKKMNSYVLSIWLSSNATKYMRGRKLIEFYKILGVFVQTGDSNHFNLIEPEKEGRVEYPEYFRLRSKIRKKQE